MTRTGRTFDVHQEITNRIVAALDVPGTFKLPWIGGGTLKRPVNATTRNPYNGVNILSLWLASLTCGHPSNLWGTYRQWAALGCQVRKGERSSLIVFYKKLAYANPEAGDGDDDTVERLMARASFVFNAAQVGGFTAEAEALPEGPVFDPVQNAEAFVRATGATVHETGDRACYIPSSDLIQMPERRRFTGTDTTTPAEGFYSTLFHELVHWSGAKQRLNRDLNGRFGSSSYAMEELVAELGAAFLCSDLSITQEPRADHAHYIASWLKVLKDDKKAVFTAASKASEAANWLLVAHPG